MSNMISNVVASIVAFFKKLRLAQVAVVAMAGLLMLTSTACNPQSPQASLKGSGSYGDRQGMQTNLYDPIQKPTSGPNTFNDTDPRRNLSDLEAKSDARIREAKQNLKNANSPREFVDTYRNAPNVGDRTRNVTERVGGALDQAREDFTEGTERGVRNLKENLSKGGDKAKDVADEVSDNLKDARRNTVGGLKDAADTAAQPAQRAANEVRGRA